MPPSASTPPDAPDRDAREATERRSGPSSGEAPHDPILEFLRLLWRVNHAMERRSRRMQRALGITGSQRTLLRLVGENSGLTAGALAELLYVDPGTLSSALGRLEAMDLLARDFDPEDRRRVRIRLTPSGEAFSAQHPETIEGSVRRTLARRSAGDLSVTTRLLSELAEDLDAE